MAIYIIFIISQYGGKVKQIFRMGEDHGYRNNTLLFTVFTLLYTPFYCSFAVEKHRESGAFLRLGGERFEGERPSIYYLAKRGRGKADKIKL